MKQNPVSKQQKEGGEESKKGERSEGRGKDKERLCGTRPSRLI